MTSFQTPLSLFPPNAIISLTDDNTTSFLARPAAFGPLLPASGLSGQLWIGSGFGDDVPHLGSVIAGAEGELGCSDVPGWNNEHRKSHLDKAGANIAEKHQAQRRMLGVKHEQDKIDADLIIDSAIDTSEPVIHIDDGTDDYLHEAAVSRTTAQGRGQIGSTVSSTHADIQSIQEGAEIAGKIVLLSRGGCGFLEKVNWVQRRGGVALIVGDDTRGGPLIQMYARGDTSNVVIPSIFTSFTTAHLLSSLIPASSLARDTVDTESSIAMKAQQPKQQRKSKTLTDPSKLTRKKPPPSTVQDCWFPWIRTSCRTGTSQSNEWIRVVEYNEEDDIVKGNPVANNVPTNKPTKFGQAILDDDDDFQIGVQDWRDPDLIQTSASTERVGKASDQITADLGGAETFKPSSLLNRLFGEDKDESDTNSEVATSSADTGGHEGLWVTLTPTSAATPFFDTLLVLVVSPLITLSIVYAMLLVRSRIRRRRWRAPKSVVEQLPVHTYHALPPSAPQTRLPSPNASSPSTPLLQSSSRPRSRTTSGLPEPGVISRQGSDLFQPPKNVKNEPEKPTDVSEWRKYMNKQVECVVCLEEYVDGVSRVMSLPCGHEFHVDCMYVYYDIA